MSCSYNEEQQAGDIVLSGVSGCEFQQAVDKIAEQCTSLTISCSASYELIDLAKIPESVTHLTLRKCQLSFENAQKAHLRLETLTLIDCRC